MHGSHILQVDELSFISTDIATGICKCVPFMNDGETTQVPTTYIVPLHKNSQLVCLHDIARRYIKLTMTIHKLRLTQLL